MTTVSLYRRVLRREMHSPRSGLAIVLAVVLILVVAWIGTEAILAFFHQHALLVAPAAALAGIALLPQTVVAPAIIVVGVVVAILGVIILLFALLPGRRARHTGTIGRTAVVVDNRVIASSLARSASYAARVAPDQVVVTIGHRTVLVRVRPTSGFPVDRAGIEETVAEQLGSFDLKPALRSKVLIDRKGIVGS